MKKIIFFGMMICASISLQAQNAGEVERLRNKIKEIPATSNAAGALDWNVSGSTLTISGKGKMPDYDFVDGPRPPWYSYHEIITRVEISAGVTSIGKWAFYDCTGLTSVTIPNSVTSIGLLAFSHCSRLTSVTIPNSVTSIGINAFKCTSITVAPGNTAYSSEGGVLFNKDKTKLVAFPIGKTGRYTIPATVSSIERNAFYKCRGLTSVIIPNSVTVIGKLAFQDCKGLTEITIPNSVTSIGERAFSYCTGLTSVTIPNSVKTIESYVFSGCSGLTEVINMATIPQSINRDVFKSEIIGACKLRVPAASLSLYQKADVWKDFKIEVIK